MRSMREGRWFYVFLDYLMTMKKGCEVCTAVQEEHSKRCRHSEEHRRCLHLIV